MKRQEIDSILLSALAQGATDIHFSAGATPMMRKNGQLEPYTPTPLAPQDTEQLLAGIASEDIMARLQAQGSADFSYAIAGKGRFRASACRQRGTYSVSFRLNPPEIPDAEALGLPGSVRELADLRSGLVLLSGAARSGKSATAAWLIHRLACARPVHIVTVEEPIEVLFQHGQGLVNQKEIGLDAPDKRAAITASLREGPDVLYISSANDAETLGTALDAALIGTLVLCQVDTPSAAATLRYLIDMAPEADRARRRVQLAEGLTAIVAHRAVSGPQAGMVLHEVLLNSEAIRGLLRQDKVFQAESVMENSALLGMQTFDYALARRVAAQQINREEAEYHAIDHTKFRQYLLELLK